MGGEVESPDRDVVAVAHVSGVGDQVADRCGRRREQGPVVGHQLPDDGVQGLGAVHRHQVGQRDREIGCGCGWGRRGGEPQLAVDEGERDQVTGTEFGECVRFEQQRRVRRPVGIVDAALVEHVVVEVTEEGAQPACGRVVVVERQQGRQVRVGVEDAGRDFRVGEPVGEHASGEQGVEGHAATVRQVAEPGMADVLGEFLHVGEIAVPLGDQPPRPFVGMHGPVLAEQDHGGFGSGICRIGHRARVCDVSGRLVERSVLVA